VATVNKKFTTFVSAQVGKYHSNWLNPLWDQMWVQ
jgi:hypothetical protein